MTDPAGTPRVSIVVLAFNQESYIEEAVAAALAQDYPNLQVVLSDDGSSDATVALIERAARDYAGPHDVVVNRTPANRGLVQHFYNAVARADGALIVAAAGDDISVPHRVSTLVAAWQDSGADALFSAWDVIEADGSPATDRPAEASRWADAYFPGSAIVPIMGVSAAYDRSVFENIAEPDFPVFAEDAFFFLMLGFRSRRVLALPDRLVRYRRHGSALTHRTDDSVSLETHERTTQKFAARAADLLGYVERCITADTGYRPGYGTPARVDLAAIRADRAFGLWQADWIDAAPATALRETIRHFRFARARWLLPRLFGLRGLALARRLLGRRG